MNPEYILEAAILSSAAPLSFDKCHQLLQHSMPDIEKAETREFLKTLETQYAQRGMVLSKTALGYRFVVSDEVTPHLAPLHQEKPPKYSRAILETLAIIAYKQPVTRAEIESIRGVVVSSQMIRTLEEHQWIKVVGHKEVPGRPALFATTPHFLEYFGLNSLSELPALNTVVPNEEMIQEALPV